MTNFLQQNPSESKTSLKLADQLITHITQPGMPWTVQFVEYGRSADL